MLLDQMNEKGYLEGSEGVDGISFYAKQLLNKTSFGPEAISEGHEVRGG